MGEALVVRQSPRRRTGDWTIGLAPFPAPTQAPPLYGLGVCPGTPTREVELLAPRDHRTDPGGRRRRGRSRHLGRGGPSAPLAARRRPLGQAPAPGLAATPRRWRTGL